MVNIQELAYGIGVLVLTLNASSTTPDKLIG
jgi:hypothetical protein